MSKMKDQYDMQKQSGDLIRVGILSDTHGRLPDAAFAALADSDYIIHAGDIGDPDIIKTLEILAPTYAVLGNNDYYKYREDIGLYARPVIGGVRFLVSHYPQDVHIGWNGGKGFAPGDPIPQVCVHGHTHVPKLISGKEAAPADYIICPGSVFRPRNGSKPSVAKLTIADGRVQDAWIEAI